MPYKPYQWLGKYRPTYYRIRWFLLAYVTIGGIMHDSMFLYCWTLATGALWAMEIY
jgi:hypothetical protein